MYTITKGTSNSSKFVDFVGDTLQFIQPGDIIIGDNCSFHYKGWSGHLARAAYHQMGARYYRLPTYSPEFNPSELVFSYLKHQLRREYTIHDDLLTAMTTILGGIKLQHMYGWYKHCGWLK